ncbi:hypothetical protein A3B87_01485 [Candidatus Kuenenbacteria bacterium RIFCSPHIGHO2_02_FULL_39_13]|uniref:Uncharacterized protein n=1 Tax=Candidatus Kuenenbacteria bacterium RIFCSPHIGHO2_02_FULL_39_13 TaxID=1798561 RepID=A0A1F6FNU2_9BACT|nr:MAG: hypothetical protein A3B87_01485 [Candidatus Kuenenbacteria bacterium RIFCSPHIGHO2_02_FULL_39_13]
MNNPVKENRIGRFYLTKALYETDDQGAKLYLRKIMACILPAQVKERMDTYEFEAYSLLFEPALPKDGIPNYKILFVPPSDIKIKRMPDEILTHFAD